ncbi:hypothetical protein [Algivirga pacifica]|uniref:DNA-binding protein n=1 Tax=Algivirga pacifica TaxID=1162670 RepID=A0ABP9D3D4_9BACT
MSLETYIERLNRMDSLLKAKRTGPPKAFAQEVQISERHLYEFLEEVQSTFNTDIRYCRQGKTYYFFREGDSIAVPVEKLKPKKQFPVKNTISPLSDNQK